jgi:hypothetical protein
MEEQEEIEKLKQVRGYQRQGNKILELLPRKMQEVGGKRQKREGGFVLRVN